jgi:KUP system potassium uptake protein
VRYHRHHDHDVHDLARGHHYLAYPVAGGAFFFLVFAALDGVYMSSALRKVPEGAWFTIVLAFILSSIFILWRWGKEQQWIAKTEDRIAPSQLLQMSRTLPSAVGDGASTSQGPSPRLMLMLAFGGGDVSTASGVGIFFDKLDGNTDNSAPKVFT